MSGNVRVVLKSVWDDKALRKAQADLGSIGRTAGVAFAAIGAAAGLAGAALVNFGSKSLTAASDLEESLNAINVSYGKASASIAALGEDAASRLGVTQTAFNQAAVRFSSFAGKIVGAGGNVTGFVDDITTRAADFASVFNIDVSEALQVFQSGLSGEAEPLKRFGINLLDTEVKAYALRTEMIKQGETLTEVQKVQARYGLLMEETAKTAGDFANTSDGLANSQRILEATTNDLFAAVGKSLLPTFAEINKVLAEVTPQLKAGLVPASEELAEVFKTSVTPAIREFGDWIASPEGADAIAELAQNIVDGVAALIDFSKEVYKNRDAIVASATAIGTVIISYGALKIAIGLATAAQLIFNTAVKANPYVLLATSILAAVSGLIALDTATLGAADTQRKADEAAKGFSGRIAELVAEERRLQEQLGKGAIGTHQYREAVTKVRSELATLQGQMMRAAGAGNALNNVSLAKFRSQLGDTRVDAEKLVEAQRELAYYMAGGKPGSYKPRVVTGGSGGGGGVKTDPVAEAKKRFDAVQKVIQDHQKKLESAEKSYLAEVFKLNQDSDKAQKALREKEVKDLEAIVKQSKRRLTDAFASATNTALSSLFNKETVREVTRNVKAISSALTITTSKETEKVVFNSIGDVIEGLRKKILGARNLINNASALAGLGFSQTFIEQVVEGGTETGNELAKAILEASPETQAELKRLFLDLEDVSANGMQSVADRIYDEQKLATAELAKLYTDTQEAANLALEEEQQRLASALVSAGLAFNLAVLEIKDEFLKAIEEFDGAFAGLGNTIKDFLAKLDVKAATAVTDVKAAMTGPGGILEKATVTENVAFKDLAPLKSVSGLVVDSVNDIAGAISYLQERIAAGNRYITNVGANSALGIDARGRVTGFEQELATLRARAAAGQAAGTTININVKTDTTQSQAMVGRTIGNIVTKYVTTGGQVLVSGNA
jgi:hypothetical protein